MPGCTRPCIPTVRKLPTYRLPAPSNAICTAPSKPCFIVSIGCLTPDLYTRTAPPGGSFSFKTYNFPLASNASVVGKARPEIVWCSLSVAGSYDVTVFALPVFET